MECGIFPDLFWSSTIREVIDLINAFTKRHSNELKIKVRMSETLADMIFERVALCLTEKAPKPRTLFEMFPQLFSEEEQQRVEEQLKQDQLNEYKAKFINYAYRHNVKKGGVNDECSDIGATTSSS